MSKLPKDLLQHRGQSERASKCRSLHHSIISNYEILETLGMGGFAKVKRARHIPTGQIVAVKIVSAARLTETQRKTINREIGIQKALVHENIAQIYEVVEQDSNIYIFIEFCSRGELFEHINKCGPLSYNRALKYFKQIYSAVCYLHYHSIAHRDIKTENVLIDERGNAKLIDFGLSSYYGTDDSHFLKTFCGSPSYLSPEMMKKNKYDPKMIDVWCLGITLYAMLRAQLPFYDDDPQEQKNRIKNYSFQLTGDSLADELFSSIFVPAKQRISLQQIQFCGLMRQGQPYQPNCLSQEAQLEAIDEELVQQICKGSNIDATQLRQSVQEKKLDSLHALYYLSLEKNRRNGVESCYDVRSSKFMKRQSLAHRKEKTEGMNSKKKSIITAGSTPKSSWNTSKRANRIDLISKGSATVEITNIFHPDSDMIRRKLGVSRIPRRNSHDSPESPKRIPQLKRRNSKAEDYPRVRI